MHAPIEVHEKQSQKPQSIIPLLAATILWQLLTATESGVHAELPPAAVESFLGPGVIRDAFSLMAELAPFLYEKEVEGAARSGSKVNTWLW